MEMDKNKGATSDTKKRKRAKVEEEEEEKGVSREMVEKKKYDDDRYCVPSDIAMVVKHVDKGYHTAHGDPLFRTCEGTRKGWDSEEAMAYYANRPSHYGSYEIQMIYGCWWYLHLSVSIKLRNVETRCKTDRARRIVKNLLSMCEKRMHTLRVTYNPYRDEMVYELVYHSIENMN
jgi:hypothetical protein